MEVPLIVIGDLALPMNNCFLPCLDHILLFMGSIHLCLPRTQLADNKLRIGSRLLVGLVEKYGVRRWSHIAQMLTGRVGKQCRERWHNHLRPNIKKDTWTEEEDKVLIQAHSEIGNKWAEIAKRLPGRTENSIKNHWNATKRRQFSRRRCCRSSKYFKSGSLLQNYIKSLTSTLTTAPTSVLPFDNQKSTTAGNKEEWKGVLSMPLKSITGTYEAPACGGPDLGIENRNVDEGIYDVGHLFDRLEFGAMASGGSSSSSEGNEDFETAMNWDLMLPLSPENVKREMDLVEMIFENNSF
ncbi:uncharacterized protein A4U43_C06F5510 [Asparagus officinalis]|uniref:Uncharacterized protein n=1 Tax=Asparagus officinalis TaxID=4686 RepID=A0A5P1EKB8_ASPOF|nr:transcription factor MYB118-like [Asparagus officinalis]ONK66224.1 uncharacterized protein A4U43_C06F5510 [Asparagus officinalis]